MQNRIWERYHTVHFMSRVTTSLSETMCGPLFPYMSLFSNGGVVLPDINNGDVFCTTGDGGQEVGVQFVPCHANQRDQVLRLVTDSTYIEHTRTGQTVSRERDLLLFLSIPQSTPAYKYEIRPRCGTGFSSFNLTVINVFSKIDIWRDMPSQL